MEMRSGKAASDYHMLEYLVVHFIIM